MKFARGFSTHRLSTATRLHNNVWNQGIISSESHPTRISRVTYRHLSYDSNHNEQSKTLESLQAIDSSISSSSHSSPAFQFLDKENKAIQNQTLAASRLGLNPLQNRFHQPIVHHEDYSFSNWPSTHTFPMDKFSKLAQALTTTSRKTHPQTSNLPRPLVRDTSHFFRPLEVQSIPQSWFVEPTGPIDPTFLHRFLSGSLTTEECRYIGFREQTSRPELISRTLLEVSGTILAAQLAFRYGLATNAAGGTHHAHRSMGAGYTILNDLAICANYLLEEGLNGGTVTGVERVLVVDCDVHQGDGTAMFGGLVRRGGFSSSSSSSSNHDPKQRLFTLSIHCASNYPRYKAKSTYDVGLPDGMGDEEYLHILEKSVEQALAEVDPHFVLYDAGVDVYVHDTLGRLKLTEEGIRRRDRWVLDRCVSAGIPCVGVIGGGYSKDVDELARRHAIVHEEAAYVWRKHKLWIQ